ncbi:uncharacterized protein LOC128226949 [Mya arenaria]|uniref:uncharacterized protein LOC128226949 n=1 Tax=Mya arenaria TaxID=6604 RepID=UPI0022E07E41|nr:uncharacterized protein LOC128226949 [Mya arenaria]XP_052793032.1 uncharacterized protein LOC128226949 [Mya arenaria]XP_052793033.1 uncharacterized protein LOC128226949 [Mya arenaria]XP_052793034.1 uncharacterized protein LOC128226949 [Mya arenaria]XP_052793036.1 uncharacterized protein LOC128226949 [Mya arenaria]XP_052793037.1 uncharacterized protein LOC128226949 [Mya arenaria]
MLQYLSPSLVASSRVSRSKCTCNVFRSMTSRHRKCRCILCLLIVTSISVLCSVILVNIWRLWVGDSTCHTQIDTGLDLTHVEFPRRIHQCFFGVDSLKMPARFGRAKYVWSKEYSLKFGYNYTLWNAGMVERLIRNDYPWLVPTYSSYGHWVRRVDAAKYAILHKYGGIYVDLDIRTSGKDLYGIFSKLSNRTSMIMYKTQPAGVGGDFLIAKPGDPFLWYILCGLLSANTWWLLPYLTTMMSTGPGYLTVRERTFKRRDTLHLLTSRELDPYIRHIRGSTWHQLDGQVIWWAFSHIDKIICYTAVVFMVVICLFILKLLLKYSRKHQYVQQLVTSRCHRIRYCK